MPRAAALGVVALAAVVLASAGAPARTAFPGRNGRIVFARQVWMGPYRGWLLDLFSVTGAGTRERRLTRTYTHESNPAWSPHGRSIAFNRSEGRGDSLFESLVVLALGRAARRVLSGPPGGIDPSWSPDGHRLAFTRFEGVRSDDICVLDLRTHAVTDLPARGEDNSPAWSPDGTKIAFASDRGAADEAYQIYTMATDGSNVTRVTVGPAVQEGPAWSPDGTQIALTVQQGDRTDIAIVNVDGSGERSVTSNGRSSSPAWSPDGRKLVFEAVPRRHRSPQLFVSATNGGGLRQVTHGRGGAQAPDWQPVG